MTNEEMLRNIEYLKEKADVSYEEAATLLERYDGNVMRVLVELERQGRVYTAHQPAGETNAEKARQQQKYDDVKDRASSFINKAFQHHVVVENGKGKDKKTVLDLNLPLTVGAAIVAPHVAVASLALMFISGSRVKIRKEKPGKMPENVESFVDQTVENIKTTASSLGDTVRDTVKGKNEDDDGGEITVE